MTIQSPSEESRKKKLSKTTIAILVLVVLLLILQLISYLQNQEKTKLTNQLSTAQQLINQRRPFEAIQVLDDVINNYPDNVEAYRLRSIAYGSSRSNVFPEQQGYFQNSLQDIDKLIELQPTNGNHYVDRNLVLRTWAEIISDSATKFHLYELAKENTEKAIELGVSPDYSYVYRHRARNLIESNHCQEGLEETQALADQTLATDPVMDTYKIYLTEAHLCLNQFDQALEIAQQIQCEDAVATCRSGFMAEIYYQMGEHEKALEILNNMINSSPQSGAWRYFIRAAILYEQGETELALQDLTTGDSYSWEGNGVYWYVKAKTAFDEGDEENGIAYLQKAESTLDIQYTPLRQEIRRELKNRGVQPLAINPSVLFDVTPIP